MPKPSPQSVRETTGKTAGKRSAALHLVTSSEARRNWKEITGRALAKEKAAILIGKRAVALRPVELTYAEEEYGVTEDELHDKAEGILGRARRERSRGKTGSGLL